MKYWTFANNRSQWFEIVFEKALFRQQKNEFNNENLKVHVNKHFHPNVIGFVAVTIPLRLSKNYTI